MSQRNSQNAKTLRRFRKMFRTSLPTKIDLVQYLKDRGHASTTGQAERLILAGRVRSDSHRLGIRRQYDPLRGKEVEYVDRMVPAEYRDSIVVLGDG